MKAFYILFLLSVSVSSTVLDIFNKNGIVYEEYGQGRLIREEQHCRPWTMDLFNYVNALDIKDITENGKIILKRRLYQSFASICQAFDVDSGTTEMPPSFNSTTEQLSLRFLDRFELAWNVQKFERDLKSLFLEHKLVAPFHQLVTENELRLFSATDAMDFTHRTTIFPSKCSVAQLLLEVRVCKNVSEPTLSGPVYAVAHAGQFVNDDQAFVFYEVSSFVMVDGENVTTIDINQCKIMFGAYIYCFSVQPNPCNLKTMKGCQLYAVKAGDEHVFMRNFGSGKIVATTAEEIDAAGNGNIEPVPSQIFTLTLSYNVSSDTVTVDEAKMMPIDYEANFPSISGDSLSLLTETPIPLYETQRKGVSYLTHKKQSPTVWDDVRDFFLHLV